MAVPSLIKDLFKVRISEFFEEIDLKKTINGRDILSFISDNKFDDTVKIDCDRGDYKDCFCVVGFSYGEVQPWTIGADGMNKHQVTAMIALYTPRNIGDSVADKFHDALYAKFSPLETVMQNETGEYARVMYFSRENNQTDTDYQTYPFMIEADAYIKRRLTV